MEVGKILDFVAQLIDSLAWPAVVLALVVLARHEIRAVLLSLQRVKYKDFEADFARRTEELEERAERLVEPTVSAEATPEPARTIDEELSELLEISPRVAMIQAFAYVERAVRDAAARVGVTAGSVRGVRNDMRELQKQELISPEIQSLFHDLRVARNELAHSFGTEVSPRDAKRYINAARLLVMQLNQLIGRWSRRENSAP